MVDNEAELFQNSIKYLHNISTLSPMNVPALKSFICLKRRLMELRKSTFVPTSATKPRLHCQRCFLNYFDGPTTYKVISKVKKHKFAKKLIRKQKAGLPLTNYQEEYVKKMNKFTGNHLVVTCSFCKNETKVKMEKPQKNRKTIKITETPSKKKKRNKKDKFCGLNQSAVMSVSANTSKAMNQSEVIFLDSDENETPIKMRMKKKKPLEASTPNVPLDASITKIKNKNVDKLTEFLKSSAKKKSSNLMQFLKDF